MKEIHNFKDFLNFYCKKNNENIYYLGQNKSESIKYSDLINIFTNFNIFLKKKKIRKKSKILVILDNSIELLLIFLSSIYNDIIFIPVNPNSGNEEINFIVKKTKPTFLITNKTFLKKANQIEYLRKYVIHKNNFYKEFIKKKNKTYIKVTRLNKNSIAQILFTSGSTGNPKGVVLTHKSMLTNLYGIHNSFNINMKNPRFLSVTPLYHNNGQFIPTLLPFVLNGSTLTISPDTSLLNFWPVCKKYKINYSSVMATHINYFNTLRNIRSHNLINLFCGGAKLDVKSQQIFEKKFKIKILCNYGLTETSSIASSEDNKNKNFFYGSVGKPLNNNRIKIINKKNKFGEILIKGENIFKCYFGNRKLTNSKFQNKWFKTGDLGYLNQKNYLFIKDRIDNMINVSGENIYPSEIENHIYKFKGIKIGIASSIPDKITQNKIIFVYEGRKNINYKKFFQFLKTKIARHKIPKKIVHVSEIGINEIPKASNKKLLRKKVNILLKNYYLK